MPAKRILFGFLLCLALWLVVLAAQALTLGTEKSLFPYRTEQVACVEFQNGTTGARHYFLLFLHQKSFIRAKLRAKRSLRARFSSFSFCSNML